LNWRAKIRVLKREKRLERNQKENKTRKKSSTR